VAVARAPRHSFTQHALTRRGPAPDPQVRTELERRLGLAVRQRHLAKLLRLLDVEVQGGAQPSAAQLRDALKAARCRWARPRFCDACQQQGWTARGEWPMASTRAPPAAQVPPRPAARRRPGGEGAL
jgi:hypothetical protein